MILKLFLAPKLLQPYKTSVYFTDVCRERADINRCKKLYVVLFPLHIKTFHLQSHVIGSRTFILREHCT